MTLLNSHAILYENGDPGGNQNIVRKLQKRCERDESKNDSYSVVAKVEARKKTTRIRRGSPGRNEGIPGKE